MARETDAQLREELEEAIGKVRHQIDIQSTADHYIGSEGITEAALGELKSELVQLEEALARLD